MVGVAQLVEHPVVVRDVAGSSPVAHPTRPGIGFVVNNALIYLSPSRSLPRVKDRLTFCDRYDSRK